MLSKDEYYCTGDESEVKKFKRKFLFDDIEVKGKYDLLLPEYQNIVYNVLHDLIGNDEFYGFNLKRFLEAYKKASPSVSQLKISREIAANISEINTDEICINKQLDYAKQRGKLREGEGKSGIEKYVEAICDCFLIEGDLLKKGIGKIYVIKYECF